MKWAFGVSQLYWHRGTEHQTRAVPPVRCNPSLDGIASLIQPYTSTHSDTGAIGYEGRRRSTPEKFGEFGTIERGDVAVQLSLACTPHVPPRMLDLILKSSAIALGNVAPVVFCDECLFGVLVGEVGCATHLNC